MTNPAHTTNPTPLQEGDFVRLRRKVFLKGLDFTMPRGEFGRIEDVDPEDPTLFLILMVRRFDELRCWDNRMPVRSSDVRLYLRVVD
jgi:hypothetical protein